MSVLKNKLKAQLVGARNRVPMVWEMLAVKQLRYKFLALKNGVTLNKLSKRNVFNLRRDIHRIEKGLSYPSYKKIFAADYILNTVNNFNICLEDGLLDESTKSWAYSVLKLYFEVISEFSDYPNVESAKALFQKISNGIEILKETPYPSSSRPISNITYDELLNLSIRRRSVRYFTEKEVSIDVVRKAYDIAKYAPSACNRQAFQFLFYNDPEIVKKLSAVPGGVSGYELPSVVVVVGRYDGYFDIRDINAPIIDSSLAIMSFLYAAETLGLGTVCINWPNLLDREEKIRKIINIESSEVVVMLIGLGYPLDTGKVPFSGKRPSDYVVIENGRLKK